MQGTLTVSSFASSPADAALPVHVRFRSNPAQPQTVMATLTGTASAGAGSGAAGERERFTHTFSYSVWAPAGEVLEVLPAASARANVLFAPAPREVLVPKKSCPPPVPAFVGTRATRSEAKQSKANF